MSTNETKQYFDLHTQGIGYLNLVREVTPKEGTAFLSVTIAALRGSVDNAQYTHFECHVSGKQAQQIVRQLKPAVEGGLKVLIGFTLSDLFAESFTFKNGDKAGQTGISLKARLQPIGGSFPEGLVSHFLEEISHEENGFIRRDVGRGPVDRSETSRLKRCGEAVGHHTGNEVAGNQTSSRKVFE